MLSINRLFTILLLVALILSACQPIQALAAITPTEPKPDTVSVPYFLRTACLYHIPPGTNVSCGYLVVPEDRSQPTSKTIRLHVVIFKSTSEQPAPEPLILLNGGPGSPDQPMIDSMLYDLIGEVWRAKRDIIYIDQRGTGFAMPSLYCPEMAMPEARVAMMSYTATMAAETASLQQCYTRLQASGINLAAFTVAESAADINDLRLALGYDQVNLYGFSYGSLLAAAVMREYPTTLHSVVLDAVLPPGIDLVQEKPGCLHSGLHTLFADCAANAACYAAYPALEQHFYMVLDRLRKTQVTVSVTSLGETQQVVVDDLKFLNYLFARLQAGVLSSLPRTIETIFAGNYQALAEHWLAYATAQSTPASRLSDATAFGTYYSTLCNYAAGISTAGSLTVPCDLCQEAHVRHPSFVAYANFMLSACTFWQAGSTPERFVHALPTTNLPTLLLTSAYDCALPPYLSQGLSASLLNSYHFVLPVGHTGVSSNCGLYLTDQFLSDPTVEPDATCIESMWVEWSTR